MNSFSEKDWQTVLAHLAEILGADARRYAGVPTAKLVAAIPYLAGSEDPDRFAVSNLLTLHGATRARSLFGHRAGDDEDPFRRLATFHVGNHADPRVVDHGLTLLALISLTDHERDAEADRRAGKPNPLNSGAWDARALREGLEGDLGKNPSLTAAFAPFADEALAAGLWT